MVVVVVVVVVVVARREVHPLSFPRHGRHPLIPCHVLHAGAVGRVRVEHAHQEACQALGQVPAHEVAQRPGQVGGGPGG